ncbi:substrate-binding domain-containing protein [Nakamurella leprariae]|uniref:Extracellular solute-binding protein n=1 Tax=Nakamurella leprariae TaxID=2803911 RepID=A0A938YBC5_9ACTN|nr:substrate-binding domain-containing protein [Nakamurella leprariae]MBM9466498.1 extracellular solute-binding protein [Nakamurella leprariae]
MQRWSRPTGAVVVAVLLLTGCTSGPPDGAAPATSGSTEVPGGAVGTSRNAADAGLVVVFAPESTKPALIELGTRFEQEHPGAGISFTFARPSDLVAELVAGAPADVLIADTATMTTAVDGGVLSDDPAAEVVATGVHDEAIAVLPGSSQPELAAVFVELVAGVSPRSGTSG